MSVFQKKFVVFLGIVYLISSENRSIASILKSVIIGFIVSQQYSTQNSGRTRYFTPALNINRTDLQTTDLNNLNAIYGDIFNKTDNYATIATDVEINDLLANVSTNIKPKRLRQRCPLKRLACSKSRRKNPKEGSSRFLGVFQIVQFEHVACTSSSGLDGTCLPEFDCQSSGGTGMGDCADGYGTCCVTQFLCDGKSTASIGWFNNPDFPAPTNERLSCTFTLDKASEDIKQLRLDFAIFELLPPSGGVCQQDQFVISGQNINNIVPILCGINTGQHVYIEIGNVEGPIYFSVQTVSADSRLFSIKITQLEQTDELAAPPGCLQYFKDSQGYLESFNYRDKSDIDIIRVPSYLNNLNYAMCIEREPKSCNIIYTNEDQMQIINYDPDGLPIIPPNQAGVEIFNCPSDWLLIAATRICGYRLNDGSVLQDFTLNAPITDVNAGPIVVWFRSDEGYVGRGFRVQYEQQPCMNPNTS